MTDSSAWLIYDELVTRHPRPLMDALFGANGLRLNFLRVPIGASDFTATGTPYTYDDLPAGQTDPTLAHFSIAHDLPYIVPALRRCDREQPAPAVSRRGVEPAGVDEDQRRAGQPPQPGGCGLALQPFALYLARFLTTYRHLGIPSTRSRHRTSRRRRRLPRPEPVGERRRPVHRAVSGADAGRRRRAPEVYGLDRGALLTTPSRSSPAPPARI